MDTMVLSVFPRPWLLCALLSCISPYAFERTARPDECIYVEEFVKDSIVTNAPVNDTQLHVRSWAPGAVWCRAGKTKGVDAHMAWFGPLDTAYDYYREGAHFITSLEATTELRMLDIMDVRNLDILAPVFAKWDEPEEFERISAAAGYAKPSWWKSVSPRSGLKGAFNYSIGEENSQSTLHRNNALDASRGVAMAVCVFLKNHAPTLHGWYHMAFDYQTEDGRRYNKGAEVLLCDFAKIFDSQSGEDKRVDLI
eukprot:GEMP01032186.1.p1 GENE.GEMP01032186.1~~GEMP01032186.1.p1  ORF type:complete len:253 (+),score=39.07 GEMP01032186.1:439-1197(+)